MLFSEHFIIFLWRLYVGKLVRAPIKYAHDVTGYYMLCSANAKRHFPCIRLPTFLFNNPHHSSKISPLYPNVTHVRILCRGSHYLFFTFWERQFQKLLFVWIFCFEIVPGQVLMRKKCLKLHWALIGNVEIAKHIDFFVAFSHSCPF